MTQRRQLWEKNDDPFEDDLVVEKEMVERSTPPMYKKKAKVVDDRVDSTSVILDNLVAESILIWDGNPQSEPVRHYLSRRIMLPMPPMPPLPPATSISTSALLPATFISTSHALVLRSVSSDEESGYSVIESTTQSSIEITFEHVQPDGYSVIESTMPSQSPDITEQDQTGEIVSTALEFVYKKIDTIVPGVDQHYLTCFNGKVGVVANKFIQDAVVGYPLLIQGIYPISNDYQGKIGKTEERILRWIKSKYFPIRKVSWNDIVPYSSNSNNSVIDQSMIEKITNIDDVVIDYFSRL
jgi:hypothetical protein